MKKKTGERKSSSNFQIWLVELYISQERAWASDRPSPDANILQSKNKIKNVKNTYFKKKR